MRHPRLPRSLAIGLALLLAAPLTARAVPRPPDFDPGDFDPAQVIDNQYFPLPVGTLFVYEGVDEGVLTRDEVCVTGDTKDIEGVQTRVVRDQAFEVVGGVPVLVEDTYDWFAQDVDGNVWYFGEDTTTFPDNSKQGSWQAGVDDARAGVVMYADPRLRVRYYQEFARNEAEDQAKVLSVDETVAVFIDGSLTLFHDVLLTEERSRFEPGIREYKYYAPGVGLIRSVIVKGGDERSELVHIGVCP